MEHDRYNEGLHPAYWQTQLWLIKKAAFDFLHVQSVDYPELQQICLYSRYLDDESKQALKNRKGTKVWGFLHRKYEDAPPAPVWFVWEPQLIIYRPQDIGNPRMQENSTDIEADDIPF